MVLLAASPGREVTASEALKIPGHWLWIARCTGECNGYYSQHAVPVENRQDFVQYLDQIVSSGLATNYRIFWLGDYHSHIPNFEYYDFKKRAWRFDWPAWLSLFTKGKVGNVSEEKESSKDDFDKNDLLILKELMKDARKKLSELSQMIGMTLPAAKYRFDNLARRGFLQDYVIQVFRRQVRMALRQPRIPCRSPQACSIPRQSGSFACNLPTIEGPNGHDDVAAVQQAQFFPSRPVLF